MKTMEFPAIFLTDLDFSRWWQIWIKRLIPYTSKTSPVLADIMQRCFCFWMNSRNVVSTWSSLMTIMIPWIPVMTPLVLKPGLMNDMWKTLVKRSNEPSEPDKKKELWSPDRLLDTGAMKKIRRFWKSYQKKQNILSKFTTYIFPVPVIEKSLRIWQSRMHRLLLWYSGNVKSKKEDYPKDRSLQSGRMPW